jgi:protein SCO1/2
MRSYLTCCFLVAFALAGCHSSAKSATPTAAANPAESVYHLRGKIVSTDVAHGIVVVDHEAIPGFMDAMTMPYQLKDPTIASDLHAGDTITADVLVSKNSEETVLLDHIVVIAQAKPDYKPTIFYHVPAPGDTVPDFRMRNQDGRTIHLDQFHGKALLLTFIYTRCPLPNFCPLMSHNFAVINRELSVDPGLYAKMHLLSISFDPVHDTPARLRSYGAEYIGSDARNAFAHWDFAAPSKPELLKMAKFFDVGISPGPDDTITHTLSTTLIGPHGKVVQFYPGNEWTPQQVVGDVKKLEANAG